MEIIGKTTIHPLLFYSGKLSGYLACLALPALLAKRWFLDAQAPAAHQLVGLGLALIGLALVAASLANLGSSTRLGLPQGDTVFKQGGLYRISRNPMYLGFDLLSLGGMVFSLHPLVMALGAYSVVVYHLIIRGEEAFLAGRFGDAYQAYRGRVRRYL